jgi:ATP-dependent Clp protease adaptor protein ClpS
MKRPIRMKVEFDAMERRARENSLWVSGFSEWFNGSASVEELIESQSTILVEAPWNVVVLNDPVNLMSYVVSVFRKVFGYNESKATELMLQVHEIGRSVVWTGGLEKAEAFARQLQRHLLLVRLEKA